MIDTVDDFRAIREHRQAEKVAAWNGRHAQIAELEAMGYRPERIKESYCYRFPLKRAPYRVDFWPSTGRWQTGPKPIHRGNDFDGLKAFLEKQS